MTNDKFDQPGGSFRTPLFPLPILFFSAKEDRNYMRLEVILCSHSICIFLGCASFEFRAKMNTAEGDKCFHIQQVISGRRLVVVKKIIVAYDWVCCLCRM